MNNSILTDYGVLSGKECMELSNENSLEQEADEPEMNM